MNASMGMEDEYIVLKYYKEYFVWNYEKELMVAMNSSCCQESQIREQKSSERKEMLN
jgi:hypothetical protein